MFATTPTVLSAPPMASGRARTAFLVLSALGVAWNLFGITRFLASLHATPDALMGGGLTAAQAQAYLSLPGWMEVAFGVGVMSGLLGSLALAARRRLALPVLAVSLAAYVALFAGDAAHGIFQAIPHQLPILIMVLAVAVVLQVAAILGRRSWLR